MKKKYVVGSIVCVLLMLVSTQLFLAPIVISDPAIHYGDAYVAEMWLSELDVSSVVTEFDDIAITHVRAFNDWVAWEEGSGNITVNWSIDIQSINHPEYYVIFGIVVYNIDNDSQVIGNETYEVTIEKDTAYSDSGSLSIPIQFNSEEMERWSDVTLFCSLGAFIQLNDTREARNFTCSAADRSVVAVDFEMPFVTPTFATYLNKANENNPPVCSWIDGWENHFSTESDMFNEQTFFQIGDDSLEGYPQYPAGTWRWGTMSCLISWYNVIRPGSLEWTVNENRGESREITWKPKGAYVSGPVWVGCQINTSYLGQQGTATVWAKFITAESQRFVGEIKGEVIHYNGDTFAWAKGGINTRPGYDDIDPQDGTIDLYAWISIWKICPHTRLITDYHLHYDENADEQDSPENTPYYWKEDCAYMNLTSEPLSVDSLTYLGITIVEVDVTAALCNEGSPIYSFAADRGETRVEFVC